MKNVLKTSRESTIRDRVALLKARILTSEMVIEYLVRLKNLLHDTKESLPLLEVLIKEQEGYINSNKEEMKRLSTDHPRILKDYQKRLAYSYIYTKNR